jgi:hypothetical protein
MLFTRKLNVVSINRAGLLAWMIVAAFPIRYAGAVAVCNNGGILATVRYTMNVYSILTATGIAPDLHRTSLLIPTKGNLVGCKCSIWRNANNKVFILMFNGRAINSL